MAGLKLLGGLVRLDALCPDGFTAAQLAEHAKVDPETARAFLNPAKGPNYSEVIASTKAAATVDGRGRPANLYRLRPNRRSDLMRRMAEIRRELDAAAGIPLPSATQLFAPLELLEETVTELETRDEQPDVWDDRLAMARLELGGVEADLRALQANALPDAVPFARRLGELHGRLAAVERAGFFGGVQAARPTVRTSIVRNREMEVAIVGAARTAIGSMLGDFAGVPATQLGGIAIKAAMERSKIDPADIDEVLMGCCLMAGLKQAPARQAAHFAGVPWEAGATTLTKMCGSAMKTAMLGHDNILAGSHDVVIAGGMESMSNAPYLVLKGRTGYRLGHGDKLMDHMLYDGLEDAYEEGRAMGTFAEECAQMYQFTREAQDDFAAESVKRAQAASNDGSFEAEIAPVTLKYRKGEKIIAKDQAPFQVNIEKIPTLRPAFRKDGTVTAASSGSISDGAAALVLMCRSAAEKKGIMPLAVIRAHATHAQEPNLFTTASTGALRKVLEKTGWKKTDIDLWEVNEAFAVVTMAAMRDIGIPHEKVNINGGACALGDPIGASGARIIVTLIHALQRHGLKKGVAGLCIGGGEATAMAIELV